MLLSMRKPTNCSAKTTSSTSKLVQSLDIVFGVYLKLKGLVESIIDTLHTWNIGDQIIIANGCILLLIRQPLYGEGEKTGVYTPENRRFQPFCSKTSPPLWFQCQRCPSKRERVRAMEAHSNCYVLEKVAPPSLEWSFQHKRQTLDCIIYPTKSLIIPLFPGHFIIKGMFLPFLLMKGRLVAAVHMCNSLLKYSDSGLQPVLMVFKNRNLKKSSSISTNPSSPSKPFFSCY